MTTHYTLDRISQVLFSSGKLSVSIYELLNDKGNNDGRAYSSNKLNLYNSSKYTDYQTVGEFTFGRSSVILGFSYNDRTVNPAVRESVNFGEELLLSSTEIQTLRDYAAHLVSNFQTVYVAGVNNMLTINQNAAPAFEIKNNKGLKVSFAPTVVNKISNNMTVPVPGIQVTLLGSYTELITFDSFSYMVSQILLYTDPSNLAALKNVFKLTTVMLGQYRTSEPRTGGFAGGYNNFGQTRQQGQAYGGQFGGQPSYADQGQFGGAPTANYQPQFGGGFGATQQQPQPTFGQPSYTPDAQAGGVPNFQNAANPFMGNPEEVGSNPFAREEQPAGSNPRFRRATTDPQPPVQPVGGKLDIDTGKTVEVQKTNLEDLAADVNGTEAAPAGGGVLNNSILAATDVLATEADPSDEELQEILGSIS